MAEIHGICDERFGAVRHALSTASTRHRLGRVGGRLLDGEPVVDIWGGWADGARTTPWERDTITNVWSTTKTMTFLCALLLADRGELDLHAPVTGTGPSSRPRQGGRRGAPPARPHGRAVRMDRADNGRGPLRLGQVHDRPVRRAALVEPGTASGYHAVTQGFLVGEIVRRSPGKAWASSSPPRWPARSAWTSSSASRPRPTPVWSRSPRRRTRGAVQLPEEACWPRDAACRCSPRCLPIRCSKHRDRLLGARGPAGPRSRRPTARATPAASGRVQSIVSSIMARPAGSSAVEPGARGDLRGAVQRARPHPRPPAALRDRLRIGQRVLPVPLGPAGLSLGRRRRLGRRLSDLDAHITIVYVMNQMGSGLVGDTRGFKLVLAALTGLGG